MKKQKPVVMWALWNYNRIMGIEFTRKGAREYADYLHDPKETGALFKTGAFRISKVAVREI